MQAVLRWGWVGLLLFHSWAVQAEGKTLPVVQVPPERFQAAPAVKPSLRRVPMSLAARGGQAVVPARVVLPPLDAAELASLPAQPQRRRAYQVGLGRDVPASLQQGVDLATWQWQGVAGGKLAHFTLASPAAARVRAEVELSSPDGVELRFYAPQDTAAVVGPYDGKTGRFWSPTLAGDTVGLELFVPEGVGLQQVQLRIHQVSHLVLDPATGNWKNSNPWKAGADCQVDLACTAPTWQETGKAVARYVFTDTDGGTYLCSGTLLADKDTFTQIPYFFTAHHCMNNQQAASTMDLFWLYANSTCGGNDANPVQTSGGAELLMARQALDTTLVRLNQPPPAGATLAGWTTTPLRAGQAVTGIHHGSGAPKKYAAGIFERHIRIEQSNEAYAVIPDPNGDFSEVAWRTGVTSPGSSGSGLWVEQNGVPYLNGTLVGGVSDCANPQGPDEYSRFERTWPFVSQWLGKEGTPPTAKVIDPAKPPSALVDGVVIARYLRGGRGAALVEGVTSQAVDIAALEGRLANLSQRLDIDGDGKRRADTDGVLLIRYLLGLRGAALVEGLPLQQATRTSPSALAEYIQTLL